MNKSIIDGTKSGLHNLKIEWLTARIVDFMMLETRGANWWISTMNTEGKFLHAANPADYIPDEEHQELAHKICIMMNRKAHYNGAWLVAWVDNSSALMCIWKDEDGDIQIMVDCIKAWSVMSKWPLESWAGKAHKAYEFWFDAKEAVAAKVHQQVKLAQGQRNPT